MVFGIMVIFIWRILAKTTLHVVLPPTYRLLARAFELPNRRFYTPATDYKSVPSEFTSANGLKTIPSVIDLPSTAGVGIEVGGIGSGISSLRTGTETTIRSRNASSHSRNKYSLDEKVDEGTEKEVKHYDADGKPTRLSSDLILIGCLSLNKSSCLRWNWYLGNKSTSSSVRCIWIRRQVLSPSRSVILFISSI